MPDLSELLRHWGYLGIFLVVVLGNIGLPVPEESVLMLAGYLVHEGQLHLVFTIVIGIVSAAAGDNAGYWIGRRLGRPAIEHHGKRIGITHERMEKIARFITRYGAAGVMVARFIPGVRVMAGPLAGAAGLPVTRFVVANLLGASLYVPCIVGIGYALAYGLGPWLHRAERMIGKVEHVAVLLIVVSTLLIIAWRMTRTRRARAA